MKDIEDEIPFAVPEGWAWCRLGEVCSFLNGFAFNSKEFKNTGIPIIRISNIAYEKVDISNCVYSSELLHEDFVAKKGDLLVALSGATTGKMGIYGEEQKAYINQRVGNIRIVVNNTIIPEYRNFFLYSQSKKILTKAYGGAQPNIGGKDILEILLPLPPLAEQKRIVTAIETIFTQIDILEQNKADLQTAVKQAKSKILDLAIHGKLVLQDPADEPASVMLEKLRAEKEAKIASGEVKRGKNDSYIYRSAADNCYYEKFDDGTEEQIEIPFNLPESWYWQKISSICEINPKNKLDNTLEISFVPMTLIDSEFNNNFTYELQRWETVKSGFSHFSDNDIGIAKITPCFENRKSVIFKNLKNKYGAGTTELHILRTNNKYIFNEYVFWFIKTDAFIKEGINNFTGAVGQQRIGKEFIAETLIPIPPLNEQVKICRTINTLMKKLDEISLNIV